MSKATTTDDRRTEHRTTRAEYHADNSADTVVEAKRMMAWILRRRDCREYAISSKALAEATGWHDPGEVGINPSTVRDAIKELRRERDLPIVSCSRGYYLIDDPEALHHELERIQDEIETRRETKRELTAAFNKYGGLSTAEDA